MQFLYKEGGDLVLMDQTSYEQVSVSADMVGKAADLMKDNLPCTVLFFNERAIDVALRRSCSSRSRPRSPACAVTRAATSRSRDGRDRRRGHGPLFIRVGDTIKVDTRTHEYVERVAKPV